MKSLRCFLVVGLLLAGALSQGSAQVHFGVGAKAGLNIGTLAVDPDPYQGATSITKGGVLGFMVGAVGELEFARMFAVQLEPGYNYKATKWEDTQGGKRTWSTGELQIPILFKVKFLEGTVRPYGFLGPNLGIVLSARDKIEGTQNSNQDVDVKNSTSSIDFALDFGGGAELKVAPNIFVTGDVRYSLGLNNLNSPPNLQPGEQSISIKSRGFQVLFGVLFRVG